MKCRHCQATLEQTFLDLGTAPPSNAYLNAEQLNEPEVYYPLRLLVCNECWLVQTEDYARADELFSKDYAYFSSVSTSWLAHAADYVEMIVKRLALDASSLVVEVASNDGYLLKNFVARQIPCLGIEPTASTAAAAEQLGIPVWREFFGAELAKKMVESGKRADLIIGNNVLAHVPDINDFVAGLKKLLKPGGTITLEFPHLMRMIEQVQFDTAYHEHFSYLSLHTVQRIFRLAGLCVWDVEELPTHGGSLRIYAAHEMDNNPVSNAVSALIKREEQAGLRAPLVYAEFQGRANKVKDDLLSFLIEQKRAGKRVAAYGAAAKGNTLLNFAGIKSDLLPYVVDRSNAKQNRFTPGSRIPIVIETYLACNKPDYVLILPWNLRVEVAAQLRYISEWGGQFLVAVPDLRALR